MIRRVMWSILVLLGILVNAIDVKCQSLNEKQQEIYKKYEDLVKNGKMTRQEAEKKIVKEVSLLYFAFEKEDIIKSEREIEFYGKVIDQNGESVEGALIACSYGVYNPKAKLGDIMDLSKLEVKRIFTNKEGMFQLKTKTLGGITVEIKGRDGYDAYGILPFDFVFDDKGNYALKKINNETTPFKRPDPNNPEIFQIRKKGEPTILITGESFYVAFSKIESESYAVTFVPDPFNGGIRRRSVEEAKRIGLRTDVVITLKKVGNDYATINIKPIGEDAGIIFSKERLYILPEKGYEKEIDIEMKKGQTYYFSVKSGIPNVYSLFCIESLIINEEKAIIECWSITNPYGERNLESGVIENGREYVEDARRNLLRGKYPIKPQIKVKSCSQSK